MNEFENKILVAKYEKPVQVALPKGLKLAELGSTLDIIPTPMEKIGGKIAKEKAITIYRTVVAREISSFLRLQE